MMLQNRVKKLLAEGRAAWGSALADASELLAKATLRQGIDFLWIDTEHRPFGINEVQLIPMLCRLEGRDAMLRVPNLDPGLIKKGLDMGCSCIMVPQVDNAEQARLAVEYCKYPPEGNRGVGPLWPMLLDVDINDYLESANRETCVIVQVETPEGWPTWSGSPRSREWISCSPVPPTFRRRWAIWETSVIRKFRSAWRPFPPARRRAANPAGSHSTVLTPAGERTNKVTASSIPATSCISAR